MAIPVTAIFDIGKTNKKFFLFDDHQNEVSQEYIKIREIQDDDGDPCDDLEAIINWIRERVAHVCQSAEYELQAINFSTYGATLVHLDEKGGPVTPLYNYLKPFPEDLFNQFAKDYGEEEISVATSSPLLGMLNAGLQLYWLKYAKRRVFSKIRHTLHFPQYLSYLFTGKLVTEPTSIGCHTRLWDYQNKDYHSWVKSEGLLPLFPEMVATTRSYPTEIAGRNVKVGVGIHDSSSALASYITRIDEPFILISTGTWSITLNPFTEDPLTKYELDRDCLNFLNIHGHNVKASRLYLGYELTHQVQKLNKAFNKGPQYYKSVAFNDEWLAWLKQGTSTNTFYPDTIATAPLVEALFAGNNWQPENYHSFEEAYFQLIWGLTRLQITSFKLALGTSDIKKVFIDGGFVDNQVYVALLKYYLPEHDLAFSHLPLGSAYGAAKVL